MSKAKRNKCSRLSFRYLIAQAMQSERRRGVSGMVLRYDRDKRARAERMNSIGGSDTKNIDGCERL